MPTVNGKESASAQATVPSETATTGPMLRPVVSPEQIGGQFVLRRKLGEGAFGAAWLADQLRTGSTEPWRSVVVKVTHLRANEIPEMSERFAREAAVLATLDNHHLVKVFGFGQAGPGQLYIAMEYGGDETLADLLAREHTLPWARAFGIGRQICEALEEAHRRGVIHRDLKPANVLLSQRDGADWVKVVDFGIARIVRELSVPPADDLQTAAGVFIGTPAYASPEQLARAPVDARSDLFSLGVVLHELITGERPYSGGPVAAGAPRQGGVPRRPSRPPAPLPPGAGAFLAKALAPDLTSRFQTAHEMAAALDTLLEPQRPSFSRSPGRMIALGTTVLTVVGIGLFMSTRPGPSSPDAAAPAPASVAALRPMRLLLRVPQAEVHVRALGVDPKAPNPPVPLSSRGVVQLSGPGGWTVTLTYTRDGEGVHARIASVPEADVWDGDRSMGAQPTVDLGAEPRRLALRAAGRQELVLIARVEADGAP